MSRDDRGETPRGETPASTPASPGRPLREIALVAGICLLMIVVLPLVLSEFRLALLAKFLTFAIVALAIDLVWGYTGMLSLGHGVFFGLGAYALAMYLKLEAARTACRTSWAGAACASCPASGCRSRAAPSRC